MSRYNTQLNTPGLNLRPRDTGSQLVSALGSVFSGTTAAASASARIQRAKDAEKSRIRNEHNRIASSAFSQAERQRVAQERQKIQQDRDKVSDSIYNTLMDPRAENPEWLLQQGIAAVDNARTQQEEDQWQQFTLSQMGAVRRLRERETTQEAANEERTYKRQLKLMMAEADAGLNIEELLRDPENMLSNLNDYYMTSAFTAAGDDIDDPNKRRMLADAAVDHAVSRFYKDGYPRIQNARQATGEMMGYEMLENSQEAFFEGKTTGTELVAEMQGVISRQFSNRTALQQNALAKQMAAQAVETLGGLPDDMTAGVAEERFDQLMDALPPGTFSAGDKAELREKFFQRALPTNASARVTQLVEVRMREFETQTNLNGTPKSSEDAAIDMLAPTRDGSTDIYGLVEDQIISEMGLDPTNENHAFALAQIREQLDRSRSSAVRSQAARLRGQADRMTLLSGTIVSTEDANAGFKATSFGSGRWGAEEASLMHDALTGAGLDPTALGIVEGSPVDFNTIHDSPEGEQVVDLVVQQFTEVWNHNGQAPTPAAMKTRIEGLLQAGGDGNLRAVTALMGKLSPGHKRSVYDKMGRIDRGRLIALEHAAVFGLDDDQVERLMSLPPESVAQAVTRVSTLARSDADYIEQSKRNGMQIIEAISEENFGTVENAQHFLVNNPMAEFFFQQLEVTAQAYAETERGVSVPNEADYRAASLAVYEDLRSRGADIITFINEDGNAIDQLVADPIGHVPSGFEVGFLWSEMDRNADPESPEVKGLMSAAGLTRETLPGSPNESTFSRIAKAMRLQELTDDRTAGMITEEEAENRAQGVLRGGDVIWRPMSPSNPRFRTAMQSQNGGIPMIPYMRRENDRLVALVKPTDFDNWPFLASNTRVTGLREERLFTEENTQNFLRSSINKFIPDFMRNAEEPEWASGLRDRADALRNDINESITRPAQEAAERLRIILTTDEDDVN